MALAQTSQKLMEFPKTRIGITPSAFLNLHPAIQLSFDNRLSKKVNFSIESAFIFNSPENAKGFRLRPGIELFIARSSWVSLTGGVHLNYRYAVDNRSIASRSREGDFLRWNHNAKTATNRIGINFSENLMFRVSKRFYLELGSGLGFTHHSNSISGIEFIPQEDTNMIIFRGDNQFQIPDFSPYFYTHLNASFSIGK
jgi:hypothetical protein